MLSKRQTNRLFTGMAVAGALIYVLTTTNFWTSFGITLLLGSLLYLALTNLWERRRRDA